jgi:hypothetical protein
MREFRDDDAGYLAWLAAYPNGYVINILRSHNATEARVHHADCRTINGQNPLAAGWTSQYVKVCAEQLAEPDQWASDQVGGPIPRCQTCHPARHPAQPTSTNRTEQAMASVLPEGRSKVQGPVAGRAVVEAWADDYIRFERRPDWQTKLRAEIRSCCGHLEPSAEQVLHATFFGAKHPSADVENVALYYIDSFAVAGRNGIRFEHGATVPPVLHRLVCSRRAQRDPLRAWRHCAAGSRWCRVSVLLPLWARAAVGCLRRLAAGANAGVVRLDRPGRVRW